MSDPASAAVTGEAPSCPLHRGRDDRKSGRLADANLAPQAGARLVTSFAAARDILRSPKVLQAGSTADATDLSNPDDISFFFLDGDLHRKRRAAVAGLFAPKSIVTRHKAVMERTMDAIVADLHRRGSAPLDQLSWQMAVDVAAEIIGLTNSDSNAALAERVRAVLDSTATRRPGWLGNLVFTLKMLVRVSRFYKHDMVPAIAARRAAPRDDVISYMV